MSDHLILSKGRLVACDTPENLEKRFAGTTTVELTAEATAEESVPFWRRWTTFWR